MTNLITAVLKFVSQPEPIEAQEPRRGLFKRFQRPMIEATHTQMKRVIAIDWQEIREEERKAR